MLTDPPCFPTRDREGAVDTITELQQRGFCVLKAHLPAPSIDACREAFWPVLLGYLESHREEPNRGPQRHFVPMPFEPPSFAPEFFFDAAVLFAENPDLLLPPYMLCPSFGLIRITPARGRIELAPGTHQMRREGAVQAVKSREIEMQSVPLEFVDVLIRHPWALHRGTPNASDTPRALVTVRYVPCGYADNSREVNSIPRGVWQSLTPEQQRLMRFPIGD